MKHSESLANIGAALSKAQGAVKVAIKTSENPHLKSKYADLGDVWEACREALAANSLSVVQLPVTDEPGYIALETMLLHASGEYISERARVRLQKDDPQGAGSGLTYLRRYALSAALGIVADLDDDGHAASQRPTTAQNRPSTPRQTAGRRVEPGTGQEAPAGGLSNAAAERLMNGLTTFLAGTEYAENPVLYACNITGLNIVSLVQLNPEEATKVYNAAKQLKAA